MTPTPRLCPTCALPSACAQADVQEVVAVLREVAEYEANVDGVVGPIKDVYALLLR